MDQARKTHPILIAAGVATLLFSLLGAAALTGLLPIAKSSSSGAAQVATEGQPAVPVQPAHRATPCASCGVIESIHAVQVQGEASGVGAVAGGVAGAVIGNQFGHGAGRTLLTLGGAAGGAYAGNAIEKNVKKHVVYRVTVRMSDGSSRTLQQPTQPPFAVGDRVRVDGSRLERA
ncbi:MAG TPA: glycine zipper 2TM domain-containing protein [Burkholderiales bacterium]|nr:glycine zipper 2TM domain-containing protein [Burkholderiales bacterium]